MASQQELQQKLMAYQMLQQQLEELRNQATLLQGRMAELESTRIALEDLGNVKDGTETFVPLGSGLFANGTVTKGDLLVDIGAGVMGIRTLKEANEVLEKHRKEVDDFAEKLQTEMTRVITQITAIGSELEVAVKEQEK